MFYYNEVRAREALSVVLKLAGGRGTLSKIMLTLYAADRQCIKDCGYPITGAVPYG